MDGFELGMDESDTQQRRKPVVRMNVALHIAQQIADLFRRRWHKYRVAGPAAANPVLRPAQLSRLFVLAAHALHQDPVTIIKEPYGNWHALL